MLMNLREFRAFGLPREETQRAALDFRRFLGRYPLDVALETSNGFEVRSDTADAALLFQSCLNALETKIGFSFLRMGDGEGRFVGSYSEFPDLFKISRKIAENVWFSSSQIWPEDTFFQSLEQAYANASMAGYCPSYRINLEYGNIWYGYFGCVIGNEFLKQSLSTHTRPFLRNWSHRLLLESTNWPKLLEGRRLCVVTCHPDSHHLRSIFDKCISLQHIQIPPEKNQALSHIVNEEPIYPDAFERVINEIDSSDSELFFVSAGVFAKIFCERIRSSGRVALDMGSTIDRILGFKTR